MGSSLLDPEPVTRTYSGPARTGEPPFGHHPQQVLSQCHEPLSPRGLSPLLPGQPSLVVDLWLADDMASASGLWVWWEKKCKASVAAATDY